MLLLIPALVLLPQDDWLCLVALMADRIGPVHAKSTLEIKIPVRGLLFDMYGVLVKSPHEDEVLRWAGIRRRSPNVLRN